MTDHYERRRSDSPQLDQYDGLPPEELRRLLRLRDAEIRIQAAEKAALHKEAREDPLTGVLNRKGFMEIYDLRQSERQITGMAGLFMMLDLDKFKEHNDTNGHLSGDAKLKEVAGHIRTSIRATNGDIVGRLGGDEFAVMAYDTSLEDGVKIAERIKGAVEVPSDSFVTVSIGIVAVSLTESFEEAYSRADRLMYDAKEAGRNQIYIEPMS